MEVHPSMNAQQMVEQFLRHRKVTEQFCAVMPEDQYDLKAWDGAMSFGAMATHLALSADFYLGWCEGIAPSRPDPATLPKSPAEIRAFLAKKTLEQAERIGRLGDDLDRPVKVRDKEVPLGIYLGQMREHEAHHKGQMMQLVRMAGVKDELFYAVR